MENLVLLTKILGSSNLFGVKFGVCFSHVQSPFIYHFLRFCHKSLTEMDSSLRPINWNKLAGITVIYPIPGGDMLKIDEQHQRLRKFWPYLDPSLSQSNNNMITPWDNSDVTTTASVIRSSYILWTFCGLIEFQLVNYPNVETESLTYKAKQTSISRWTIQASIFLFRCNK